MILSYHDLGEEKRHRIKASITTAHQVMVNPYWRMGGP